MTRANRMKTGLAAAAALMSVVGVARAETPAAFATLPAEVQALYLGVEETIQPSAYDNFGPVKQPWKWCHSESYQGNPWRVSVTRELERLVDLYKAKGWISDFEMSDSNGDTGQQIAQIRAFIDKKCSIITSFAGSSTALNEVIEASFKAGIPFVTGAGAVTSPYAINVDSNYVKFGYDVAKGVVEGIGGKGNVYASRASPAVRWSPSSAPVPTRPSPRHPMSR